MITTAFVKIWGELAGAVAWDEQRKLGSFEYDLDFLKHQWDLAPMKMPIKESERIFSFPELRPSRQNTSRTFKGLPGLLADVLPDRYGNQLLEAWLARQGRPAGSMNPVEQLCFIGSRGIGALEFEPAHLTEGLDSFALELNSLIHVSRKILDKRTDFSTQLSGDEEKAMMDILKIGTSAGGARPKAVIAFNEESSEVRSGQAGAPKGFEHWLLKLDGVSDVQLGDSQGYGRVEMAYYKMATDSGIEMMESRLLEENGRAHFMTKRFDREGGSGRHHMQTWCAMQHFDFNDILSYSYEQLFQTIRRLKMDYQSMEQMFRRMAFNLIARNCDDHTKNFSFILKKNQAWSLAPAYDICHAYRPDSYWVSQHALSINGKRKDFNREDLLAVAKSMNIKKADQMINEIRAVVDRWEDYADEYAVDAKKRDSIRHSLIPVQL